MLIAAYVKDGRSPEEIEELLGELHATSSVDVSRARVVIFSPTGRRMALPLREGVEHSMLFPVPSSTFDAVLVSPRLRLFANSWSRALIAQLGASLVQEGELWLPAPSKRGDDGLWSERWLADAWGAPIRRGSTLPIARFRERSTLPSRPSVLEWYFRDYARAAVDDWIHAAEGSPSIPSPQPAEVPLVSGESREASEGGPFRAHFERFVGAMNYSVWGASYKASLLSYIIGERLGGRTELRWFDMGGGAGMVAIELLLTCSSVSRSTVCDPMERNNLLMARIGRFFGDDVRGRLELCIGRAEGFPFPQEVDGVSFIGSLLYVPREYTREVLDRAWDALGRGGLLVVHENIKSSSYEKDYGVMFEVREIDGLLERYGKVERYLSTATKRVTREEAAAKTVFRVVQK